MIEKMQIEKKHTAELLPAEYNPRKDLKPGDAEYENLKRSIEQFGYVEPVIWNKTTGRVVGGHQRLKVLIDLGITEVECVVVEMDEDKEKALNIALNKISGDWDKDKLALLIADLQGADFDVSLTGFEPAEIDALFKDTIKDGVKDYDIESTTPDGRKRYIEVKSITEDGSFSITNNEYTAAHQYGEQYYLCLLIQSAQNTQAIYVQNPLKTLKFEKRIRQWEWYCDTYSGESFIFEN